MSQPSTDLIIVGGGLVGLTAALTLAKLGVSVVVLEARKEIPVQSVGLDARSIALSISSVQMLKALGLWSSLKPQMAAIQKIHVSSQGHWGVSQMQAKQLKIPALGYVVENTILLQQLHQAASNDDSIELIMGAEFDALQQTDKTVKLQYKLGSKVQSLTASLVIAADGALSKLRDFLGITFRQFDYQQSVIIANVELEQPGAHVAFERFSSHGPLAMLPLTGNRYAMVWTDTEAHVEQLMALDEAGFMSELQQQFGFRLGYFKAIGQRNHFPLQRIRADQQVAGRCVLLGNAVNTLHPVAGQGLNLAFRDIAQLFDQLFDALQQSGFELTSTEIKNCLLNYQQSRLKDHDQVIRFGDGLVQLFSNNLPGLNHGRAAALGLLDVLPCVKTEVAMMGMGFGQPASSLMRGVLSHE